MPNSEKLDSKFVACMSLIDASANKCSKCGEYQDWRRFVIFGNASIAVIAAFVAIIGTVLSWYILVNSNIDNFSPRVVYANIESQSIEIDIYNSGTIPAYFQGIYLRSIGDLEIGDPNIKLAFIAVLLYQYLN